MELSKNKQWLPWLSKDQREEVFDRLNDVVFHELSARHWGYVAPGKSPGGNLRVYITDIRGLFVATGIIRYTLQAFQTDIYYRGQSKDYPLIPRLYRGLETKKQIEEKEKWFEEVCQNMKSKFDPKGSDDEREALAQHYGLTTRRLDVVDHAQTAIWFAYHRSHPPMDPNSATGCSYDGDVGYIYLIAVPRNDDFVSVIDLRQKPSNWLRPHIQQAYSIKAKVPHRDQGKLHNINILTFIAPRNLLKLWSNYSVITPELMFPNYHQDAGLRYWIKTEDFLIAQGLLKA